MVALLKHCCCDDENIISVRVHFSYFFKDCSFYYSTNDFYSLRFDYYYSLVPYTSSLTSFTFHSNPDIIFQFKKSLFR